MNREDYSLFHRVLETCRAKSSVSTAKWKVLQKDIQDTMLQNDLDVIEITQLQEDNKRITAQKGIACLKHDLIHYMKCGHCYDELQEELTAIKGAMKVSIFLNKELQEDNKRLDQFRVDVIGTIPRIKEKVTEMQQLREDKKKLIEALNSIVSYKKYDMGLESKKLARKVLSEIIR